MTMSDQQIEKLLELIQDIVNEPKPWREKRDRVLECASSDAQSSLREFGAWFDGDSP